MLQFRHHYHKPVNEKNKVIYDKKEECMEINEKNILKKSIFVIIKQYFCPFSKIILLRIKNAPLKPSKSDVGSDCLKHNMLHKAFNAFISNIIQNLDEIFSRREIFSRLSVICRNFSSKLSLPSKAVDQTDTNFFFFLPIFFASYIK